MTYLLSNAGWLVVLLTLFFLAGSLPRRWLPTGALGHLDDVLLRLALGAGLMSVLVFLFASVGLLRPSVLVPATLVTAALGVVVFRQVPLAGGPASQRTAEERWPLALLATTLALTLLGLWLHAQRPDVATDADVYHLTVPRLWLEHGGFYRIPFNVYSNWPMATQLLYGLAMVIDDHVLAKQLHFAFGMLAATVAYLLVLEGGTRRRPVPSTWAGTVAAALVLANPVVAFEIRIAYVDLAQAFFFALAFLFLHRALEAGEETENRRGSLLVAGLLAGLVCSGKLNGFFAPAVLWAVWLGSGLARRSLSVSVALGGSALLLLPSLVLLLPWLIKSWLLTGNPVYPLLYDLFGGPEWSAALAEQHAAWQRAIGMGREPVDWLLLPVRVILHGNLGYATFDGALSRSWIVLLPLSLLGVRRDPLVRRALGACALYFLLWAVTSQQIRFLVPLLPLLAASTARVALALATDLRSLPRRIVLWAGSGATAILLLHAAWPYLQQTPRLAADLWRHGEALQRAVVAPAYRAIESELPEDARLMLVNTNRGFFVTRPWVADSFFEASQLAARLAGEDRSGVSAALRELGITHVLLDRRNRGVDWPQPFLELLQDPTVVEPVYQRPDDPLVLLALRDR